MEACGPIAKLLSKQEAVKQILPIVQRLSEVRAATCKPLSRRGHSCGFASARGLRQWLHGGPQGHLLKCRKTAWVRGPCINPDIGACLCAYEGRIVTAWQLGQRPWVRCRRCTSLGAERCPWVFHSGERLGTLSVWL